MDNMLYIIIGLVVVLLVAVLVLRKNKAQQSATQSSNRTDKDSGVHASTSKTESTGSNQNAAQQNATKFDPLAVAQRFMDQQRYDKAIESIERGLIEKPKDSKLLLKLLNIYAITNQHNDFTKTYNVINSSDDATAINDANQLKSLLDQEQTQNKPVEPKAGEAGDEAGFESLDFDLSTPQTATDIKPASNIDSPKALNEPVEDTFDKDYNPDDSFDLTLDDLATANVEMNNLESIPSDVNDFDTIKETSVERTPAEPVTIEDVSKNKNINVDDDFTLDFDLMSDDNNVSELNFDDVQVQNSQSQDISSEDDFVLELDDLVEETDSTDFLENSTQTDGEDFALPLDNADSLVVENSTLSMDTLDTQADLDKSSSVLELDGVEDNFATFDAMNANDELSVNEDSRSVVDEVLEVDTTTLMLDTEASDSEVSSTEALDNETFDDEVLINDSIDNGPSIDNEFDFDSVATLPTASMPVENENNVSFVDENVDSQNFDTLASPDIDFAAQFATDFDFVNTLDSNQVTLDLAGQYLQLGEYDSAKRLLNEVITQGNSEQQNQAQEMLARTA